MLYLFTSKYLTTQWYLAYYKVRMQLHKFLFCSLLPSSATWLRLHQFPLMLSFFLNYFIFHIPSFPFFSSFLSPPLSISSAYESLCPSDYGLRLCKTFAFSFVLSPSFFKPILPSLADSTRFLVTINRFLQSGMALYPSR